MGIVGPGSPGLYEAGQLAVLMDGDVVAGHATIARAPLAR